MKWLLRSIAFENAREGIDDGYTVFALDYLAQSCDLNALARLNHDVYKKYEVMGCSYLNDTLHPAWDDAVKAFGRCNYVPAAQNLVDSLDSVCLGAASAGESLKQMFPGYCSNYSCDQMGYRVPIGGIDIKCAEEKQQCYEKLLHPDPKATNH
jgi:hypothetical protein